MDDSILISSVSSDVSVVSSPSAETTLEETTTEPITEAVIYQIVEADPNNSEFQSFVLNSLIVIIVLLGSILGAFLVRLLRK